MRRERETLTRIIDERGLPHTSVVDLLLLFSRDGRRNVYVLCLRACGRRSSRRSSRRV